MRGKYEGSFHYVMLVKIEIKGRWENGKVKVSKVLSSE